MLAPLIHILPLTTIMRTRLMPASGKILAGVGQKVSATDLVADCVAGRKHVVIDVVQKLSISQRQATKLIKVKKGQKVSKGELLAEAPGLFGGEVVAPADGIVVASGSGKIALETGGASFELQAGIPGVVAQAIGTRGVIIRATGALIQGVWGNGKIDYGQMRSVMDRPDDVFDPAKLDVDQRGVILLGGHVESAKVFQNAAELLVRGLIITSLAPTLLSQAAQTSYPIVVLEGFGRRPLNSSAYKLLTTSQREVCLNAETYDRLNSTRPEVFIPLPFSQEPPEPREMETFAPGQSVRVVFLSKASRLGSIVQLRPQSTLPSGIKVNAAEVRLESGEQILAPLTNLEVLG